MHENTKHWDPFVRCYVYWSTWQNGRAAVVPVYISKFRAWRPTQQRARDSTIVRHKRGGLKKAS
jgi:hypothetical protein